MMLIKRAHAVAYAVEWDGRESVMHRDGGQFGSRFQIVTERSDLRITDDPANRCTHPLSEG